MRTKTVFITGSSRGIGRACALRFAAAGYHVFINCKKSIKDLKITENEITQSGGSCTSLTGDVSNPDDVRRIFHEIERICSGLNDGDKHLDVLVNNAGVAYIGLLTDMSDADWDHILFHVGHRRRFLRGCLFRCQIRLAWAYKGARQRTCSKQYSGQCHCLRRHRYCHEQSAYRNRKKRAGIRDSSRKICCPKRSGRTCI